MASLNEKILYGSVNGTARLVDEIYGRDLDLGISRRIDKIYGSVNGVSTLTYISAGKIPSPGEVVYYPDGDTTVTPVTAKITTQAELDSLANALVTWTTTLDGVSISNLWIKEVTLPTWATTTPDGFLRGCTRLDTLNYDFHLNTIGDDFLNDCSIFNQALDLSYITSIGDNFLSHSVAYNQALDLSNLTVIPDGFLYWCTAYNQSITLGNITSIGNKFLSLATSFDQDITIPSTTTAIGDEFLFRCDSITSTVVCNASASVIGASNYVLSTDNANADSYTQGIQLGGTYASEWKTKFADRDTSPYRKLIFSSIPVLYSIGLSENTLGTVQVQYGVSSWDINGVSTSGTVTLYRGTSSNPTTQIDTYNATGINVYNDISRNPNTKYYYRVLAVNSLSGEIEDEVSIVTKPGKLGVFPNGGEYIDYNHYNQHFILRVPANGGAYSQSLQYRYKVSGGSFGSWTNITTWTQTSAGNQLVEIPIETNNDYVFEFRTTTTAGEITSTYNLSSIPTHIGPQNVVANLTDGNSSVQSWLSSFDGYANGNWFIGNQSIPRITIPVDKVLSDIRIEGNTTQFTTTGKNLYKNYASTKTQNGVTITMNPDDTITLNGTSTGQAFVVPQTQQQSPEYPAGTYTFSLSQMDYGVIRIETYRSSNLSSRVNVFDSSEGGKKRTFTTSEPLRFRISLIVHYSSTTSHTYNNYQIENIQLESGSNVTSYEPYTGGEASPSPDFPQEVVNVTGEQTITFASDNLFNYLDTNNVGGSVTVDSDGFITVTLDNSSGTGTKFQNYFTNNLELSTSTNYAIITEIRNVSGSGSLFMCSGNATTSQMTSNRYKPFSELHNGQIYKLTEYTKSSFDNTYQGIRSFVQFAAGESGSITFRISVLADTSVTPETFAYVPYSKREYTVNLGKNLQGGFDNDYSYSEYGVSFISKTDGTITASGTATNVARSMYLANARANNRLIMLYPGTYTLSGGKPFIKVQMINASGNETQILETNSSASITITEAIPVYIRVQVNNGATVDTTITPQLEKGSVATTYSSYFTPIELCKIGDKQDYIYKSGDDWYIHKETTHIRLRIKDMDNSESFPGWKNQTILRTTVGTNLNQPLASKTNYLSNICTETPVSSNTPVSLNTNYTNGTLWLATSYWGSSWNQTYWKNTYPNLTFDLYYANVIAQTDTQITEPSVLKDLNATLAGITSDGATLSQYNLAMTQPNNLSAVLPYNGSADMVYDFDKSSLSSSSELGLVKITVGAQDSLQAVVNYDLGGKYMTWVKPTLNATANRTGDLAKLRIAFSGSYSGLYYSGLNDNNDLNSINIKYRVLDYAGSVITDWTTVDEDHYTISITQNTPLNRLYSGSLNIVNFQYTKSLSVEVKVEDHFDTSDVVNIPLHLWEASNELSPVNYEIELWDWKTNTFIADLSYLVVDDLEIQWELNDIEEINFSMDLFQFEKKCAEMGLDSEDLLKPYAHDIRIRRNGEYIVGCQIVETSTQIKNNPPATISIKATGFLNLLKDQYILQEAWSGYTYAQIAQKLVQAAQSPDALIKNPTCDIDTSYWLAAAGTISSSENSHSGARCLMATRSGTGWITVVSQMFVDSGTNITVDAWIKAQNGCYIQVVEREYVTTSIGQQVLYIGTGTGDWQHIQVTASTFFENGYIGFECERTDSVTPLYVDDAYIYAVNDDAVLCNLNISLGTDTASLTQNNTREVNYELQNIKDALIDLTQMEEDNFDFEFLPDRTFNIYGRKGTDKLGLELTYPGNIDSATITRSAANLANKIIGIGSGIGDERLQVCIPNNPSREIYGTREAVNTNSNISLKSTLMEQTIGNLYDRKDISNLPKVKIKDGSINPSNIETGDIVLVSMEGSNYLSSSTNEYKVMKIKLNVSEDAVETMDLTLSAPIIRPEQKKIRYIRDSMTGNSVDNSKQWNEIQALMLVGNDYINIAQGQTVYGSSSFNNNTNGSMVVDGDPATWANMASSNDRQAITIDLGDEYPIDYIKVWHYYPDNRQMKGVHLSVGTTLPDGVNGTADLETVLWADGDNVLGAAETSNGRRSVWLQEENIVWGDENESV